MNHAQRTSATRPRRPVGRIIVIVILVLPLLGCCYLLDLWQAIPPLRYAWMHHIPQVQGRLEVLARSLERGAKSGVISSAHTRVGLQ